MLFMTIFTTCSIVSSSVATRVTTGVTLLLAAEINAAGNLMCGIFSGLLN